MLQDAGCLKCQQLQRGGEDHVCAVHADLHLLYRMGRWSPGLCLGAHERNRKGRHTTHTQSENVSVKRLIVKAFGEEWFSRGF